MCASKTCSRTESTATIRWCRVGPGQAKPLSALCRQDSARLSMNPRMVPRLSRTSPSRTVIHPLPHSEIKLDVEPVTHTVVRVPRLYRHAVLEFVVVKTGLASGTSRTRYHLSIRLTAFIGYIGRQDLPSMPTRGDCAHCAAARTSSITRIGMATQIAAWPQLN